MEGSVTISRKGAERLAGGHTWIYRSDVEKTGPGVAAGSGACAGLPAPAAAPAGAPAVAGRSAGRRCCAACGRGPRMVCMVLPSMRGMFSATASSLTS